MKKLIGLPMFALALLLPAGLAFADRGDQGSDQKPLLHASITTRIGADNQLEMDEESHGVRGHFGTTTPPNIMHEHATSSEITSSTHANKSEGHELLSIKSFWNWILGLPATTTIGDVRAQIVASTTASSTVQTHVNESFLERLVNFFRFGK